MVFSSRILGYSSQFSQKTINIKRVLIIFNLLIDFQFPQMNFFALQFAPSLSQNHFQKSASRSDYQQDLTVSPSLASLCNCRLACNWPLPFLWVLIESTMRCPMIKILLLFNRVVLHIWRFDLVGVISDSSLPHSLRATKQSACERRLPLIVSSLSSQLLLQL